MNIGSTQDRVYSSMPFTATSPPRLNQAVLSWLESRSRAISLRFLSLKLNWNHSRPSLGSSQDVRWLAYIHVTIYTNQQISSEEDTCKIFKAVSLKLHK